VIAVQHVHGLYPFLPPKIGEVTTGEMKISYELAGKPPKNAIVASRFSGASSAKQKFHTLVSK